MIDLVTTLLTEGLMPGTPKASGPLTLVPVFGRGTPAPPYLTAAEAIVDGSFRVEELQEGAVSTLVAVNDADLPVLLIDGDQLIGAMQDRIVNTSVLLAARQRTLIPVSCVEQGRWHAPRSRTFEPAPYSAHPRLRARNMANVAASLREGRAHAGNQGEVWDEVATRSAELGVDSHTGRLGDAFEGRQRDVRAIGERFTEPEKDQLGVVVFVGGEFVSADVFDRPGSLRNSWSRLVGGYALDAVDRPAAQLPENAAESLLREAASGQATEHPGVGLGTDVVITTASTVAAALVWEQTAVHLRVMPKVEGTNRR